MLRWNTEVMDDMTYVWDENGRVVVSWRYKSVWRSMRFFGSIVDNLKNELSWGDECYMELVKGGDVVTPSVEFLSSMAVYDESLPMPDWSWGVGVAFDVLGMVRDEEVSAKWYADNLERIVYLGLSGYNSSDTIEIIQSEQ